MYWENTLIRKLMKNTTYLVLIFLLTLGFILPAGAENGVNTGQAAPEAVVQLSDIQGNWAAPQISEWVNKGLVKGYQDNTFKPDNKITRAEFMAMANRAFAFTATVPLQYKDVAASDWFSAEIAKAQAAAYISGYQDGTIRPNATISRQEAASMIIRMAKLQNPTDTAVLSKFKDVGDIPEWSKAAIATVVDKKFMNGYPDQTFQPARSISRAEAIVTFNNVITAAVSPKAAKIFDKAGTYGGESSIETIDGDVTISVAGVTLQNMKITGKLLLAEGISNGDVTLKKVTVQGSSTIKGGGANSIKLEDCTLPSLTINKEGVRVVASGNTSVTVVQLESGAALVQTTSTGQGFGTVSISEIIPAGANISLTGNFTDVNVAAAKVNVALTSGTISKLEVLSKATGSKIDLSSGTKVNTLTLNAAVSVTGKGTIDTAQQSVPGTSFSETVTVGKTSTTSGAGGGTGTGGGGGNNPLSFVSSDPADGSTGVSSMPTIKLTFDRGVVRDYWDNNQSCISMTNTSGQSVGITVFRAANYTDDSEKRIIYLTPSSSLTAGSTYTITVSAALKANNGNTLGAAKNISFTVAGSSGGDGGGGISAGTLTISDGDGSAGINAPAPNGPADGAQVTRSVMTFKLTANAVENIIIPAGNNINIGMSNISGLSQTDLTNIELYTDPNGDGKTSDGASIALGTLGAINGGNAAITFNLNTQQTVAASVYMNYIVRLDTTANWGDGDTFTFGANSIGITANGATSQQAATIAGSITERAFVNPVPVAGAPAFSSASVTTDGSVGVIFSKEMETTEALAGKAGQFAVKVNGSTVEVTGLQRASTTSKLKISLLTPITSGQTVAVKYTKDADVAKQVKASDGGVLETFSYQNVTNSL